MASQTKSPGDHRRTGSLQTLPDSERATLQRLGSQVTRSTKPADVILAGAFVNLALIDPRGDDTSLGLLAEQVNYHEGDYSVFVATLRAAGLMSA